MSLGMYNTMTLAFVVARELLDIVWPERYIIGCDFYARLSENEVLDRLGKADRSSKAFSEFFVVILSQPSD